MENIKIIKGGLGHWQETAAEMALKDGKEFPYSGVWVFSGMQGSGKTLLMMHVLKEIVEENPEAIIVSNISIYGMPSIPYKGVEDFERYHNGNKGIIYVLDEIQILFSSLASKDMPEAQLQIWSQSRKNRRLILGTSQRFTRVAKGVREQAMYNFECTAPLLKIIFPYQIKMGECYDDHGQYIGERPKQRWYVPKASVMRSYSSLEVVTKEGVIDE